MCASWAGLGEFMERVQVIRAVIATGVLIFTLSHLSQMTDEDIALIAIFSSIAGAAATFLFTSASNSSTAKRK